LHLTKCWEGVVENPQFSNIVSHSLCEIQDLVSIVHLNFLKWKNSLYKKFGSSWSLTTWYSNVLNFKQFSLSFDQVWPKPAFDFKHMCLGLVKIYPNGKCTMYQMLILMISNSFVFKIVSFEVIKWVIRPSLKHSILNFERIHSHAPVFRTLEGLN